MSFPAALERLEQRLNELGHTATLIPGIDDTKKPQKEGWRVLPAGAKEINPGCTLLLTGEQSGVFVIDLDNVAAITTFEQRFNPPETFTIRTKRGCHLYFQLPDFDVKTKAKLIVDGKGVGGLDSRGWGGYVVAPGFGGKEVAVDAPIAKAPASLLELWDIRRGSHLSAGVDDPPCIEPATGNALDRGIRLAIAHAAEVGPCIKGGAQEWIYDVCKFLGADCQLDIDTAWSVFDEHYNPKCFAEDGVTEYRWARSESDRPDQDASCFDRHFIRAVRSEYARAVHCFRRLSKEGGPRETIAPLDEVYDDGPDGDAVPGSTPQSGTPPGNDPADKDPAIFDFHEGGWDVEEPEIPYLVGGLIPAGTVGMLVAPGESLKSWILISLLLAVASGGTGAGSKDGKWLGHFPVQQGRAYYIDYESDRGEAKRRLRILQAGAAPGFVYANTDYDLPNDVFWQNLPQDGRLYVIDSLSEGQSAVDENSTLASRPLKLARKISRATGAVFIFLHHVNKGEGNARDKSGAQPHSSTPPTSCTASTHSRSARTAVSRPRSSRSR